MTDYHWPQIRDHAIEIFAEAPSPQLEEELLQHFAERPAHVANLIDRIAAKVQAGKIHSGWAVVRKELHTPAAADVSANDSAERQRRIRNTETWIRNAGIHYDRESDVEADLFGDDYANNGRLQDYADDPALRARLLELWQTERPRGEQAEQDHEAWNAQCAAGVHLIRSLKRTPVEDEPEPTADPNADLEFDLPPSTAPGTITSGSTS